ncbi:fimbrial protein [Buttiauxella agrestis]|uniref:fimbrial protein n=1 Tax=Buttiauxella agrestis TaxID=82977 RepID=UPI003975548A
MKNIAIKVSLITLLVCATAHAASPVIGAGGTIDFTGKVVDTACAVDISSADQNIDLGEVRLTGFSTGKTSPKTSFTIKLGDCDSAIAATAKFGFTGQTVSGDTSTLENLDAGANSAEGVGIQLMDLTGDAIVIDGSFGEGTALTLNDGENIASFSAMMTALTDTVKAGSVHSTVNFKIQYE